MTPHIEQHDPATPAADGNDTAMRRDGTGDDGGSTQPARDGLKTVAFIVALAAVVAAATVVWARMSMSDAPTADTQQVPAALADGRQPPPTPDALTETTGMPVIMAAPIDRAGRVATGCGADSETVLGGFVTPDYATVLTLTDTIPMDADVMVEEEAPPGAMLHVACAQQWTNGGWTSLGHAAMPVDGGESYPAYLCCTGNGRAARYQTLAVPDTAAWLVEDRDTYGVGYDVAGLDVTGIAVPEPMNGMVTMHVWWIDGAGLIIGEEYAGG